MVNIKMTELSTYNGTKTLEAVTSFLSTLHHHFGPSAQESGLTDESGILLTNSWAAMALRQFPDEATVWANYRFLVYTSVGIIWKHFSAAVKEACITSNTVTRLKHL
jgi:hypothetical protein